MSGLLPARYASCCCARRVAFGARRGGATAGWMVKWRGGRRRTFVVSEVLRFRGNFWIAAVFKAGLVC